MATVSVPNASDVADRWESGASGAGSRYETNALDASDEWLSQASGDAAQRSYEQAMQDPDVLARRQSNTTSDAQSRYESSIRAFGSGRYQQGVSNAKTEYQSSIGEVLSAIDGLNIPDRGRPLSQANQDRALQVQRALHEAGQSV